MTSPEKKRLEALGERVHKAVRSLKMGQMSNISLNGYTFEEVRAYMWGYASFKRKWFRIEHDEATKSVRAVRVPPLPTVKKPDKEEVS